MNRLQNYGVVTKYCTGSMNLVQNWELFEWINTYNSLAYVVEIRGVRVVGQGRGTIIEKLAETDF